MKWRYDRSHRRLNVSNTDLDLAGLRTVLANGMIPEDLETVVYTTAAVTMIMRGHCLCRWLSGEGLKAVRCKPLVMDCARSLKNE
jgi:hypothetical protein